MRWYVEMENMKDVLKSVNSVRLEILVNTENIGAPSSKSVEQILRYTVESHNDSILDFNKYKSLNDMYDYYLHNSKMGLISLNAYSSLFKGIHNLTRNEVRLPTNVLNFAKNIVLKEVNMYVDLKWVLKQDLVKLDLWYMYNIIKESLKGTMQLIKMSYASKELMFKGLDLSDMNEHFNDVVLQLTHLEQHTDELISRFKEDREKAEDKSGHLENLMDVFSNVEKERLNSNYLVDLLEGFIEKTSKYLLSVSDTGVEKTLSGVDKEYFNNLNNDVDNFFCRYKAIIKNVKLFAKLESINYEPVTQILENVDKSCVYGLGYDTFETNVESVDFNSVNELYKIYKILDDILKLTKGLIKQLFYKYKDDAPFKMDIEEDLSILEDSVKYTLDTFLKNTESNFSYVGNDFF